MQERKLLKSSVLLCGESDGKKFGRTFIIEKKLEEGASSVCYEAWHENSAIGVLKEFYPKSVKGLKRNAEGQLVFEEASADGKEAFEQAKKEYIEPYLTLRDIVRESENRRLRFFIPEFEIYDGCDNDYNVTGSVYVWMPRPRLETFDRICDDIHQHPSVKPECKLVTVLHAVKYLTECIQDLHQEGLLHRDIKPSNFGFLGTGDEVLEQTLTMFDINTVCSVEHVPELIMGTQSYMEPEAAYERATNQTDIYAIGATLFHAVIVSEETKKGHYLYRDEYYDRLKELVDNSMLVQSSEANSYPRLRYLLTRILQKCLCERERRYGSCEELLEDINAALYYALPTELAGKSRSGEKWALIDVERSFDRNRESNVSLALQYHLYAHPLYECAGDSDIHVLIIGFGNYGQRFLDACLQIGRIGIHALNVTIVSDDIRDMELYLMDRPALPEFFTGTLLWEDETKRAQALEQEALGRFFHENETQEDSYGNVVFQVTKLERDNQKANENILENVVMCDHCDTNYVLVALGDDALNLAAAKTCKSVVDDLQMQCMVNYVQEWEFSPAMDMEHMCAVYVNADLSKSAQHSEIERMAFNTHLTWEKNLNVDFKKVRSEYRKRYNHDSCVSHVVAVKYWLYGMGIDLDDGCSEAAKAFEEKALGTGEQCREIKKELTWLEHSRWVTEKLCMGWRPIEDLKTCMDGTTKDERKKVHVCIRKSSRTKESLAEKEKAEKEKAEKERIDYWDKKNKKALRRDLDDLDRMSVELHRAFVERAEKVKEQGLLDGNVMQSIRDLLGVNREAMVAFNEWSECIVDLWHGDDRKRAALYQGLRDQFLASVSCLPDGKSIKAQVVAFEKLFYPILASMKYEDYKQKDVDFVDQIPFMLTYTQNAYLAVPFHAGNNSEVFKNVAAATVVHPARILYLCFLDNERDEQYLKETIPRIVSYMDKRKLRSRVEFVIGYIDYLSVNREEKLGQSVKELAPRRVQQVTFIQADEEELEAEFRAYLEKRRKRGRMIALEKNRANLFSVPFGSDFYKSFPSFKFDAVSAKFSRSGNCSLVTYIKKKPYITVDDMVALRCSVRSENHSPEFSKDYENLWKLYRNGGNKNNDNKNNDNRNSDNKNSEDTGSGNASKSMIWKTLCSILKEYPDDNSEIALFKKLKKEEDPKKYTYIMPAACRKAIFDIIKKLQDECIAAPESKIEEYTIHLCKVTIWDKYGNQDSYDKLFASSYALLTPDAIAFGSPKSQDEKIEKCLMLFDNLAVKEVSLTNRSNDNNSINNNSKKKSVAVNDLKRLLRALSDMGYVINLKDEGSDKVSFVYAAREIKELLTVEGKLLEVYVYHKLKNSGSFDDIVSGYEVRWEGSEVKNEFDCLVTKGFQTFFIECKARTKIEADFYYKLANLTEQFGINPIPVLITDTGDKHLQYENNRVENNKMQIARGDMMEEKVVTIWKEDDIQNIDKTLKNILNGRYKSE